MDAASVNSYSVYSNESVKLLEQSRVGVPLPPSLRPGTL